ncbi:PAS domain S-box protein [Azospirillum doebereinerae]
MLVESVRDYAIYLLDPQGIVSSWNSGAERFKGYSADEIIGQPFSRFYSADDQKAGVPQRALATALSEGKFEAEGWRIRKDGSRFWASVVIDPIRDDSGRLIGFAKVTRDITDRKAAEEALRQSNERFRLLVQGVTDYAIFMLDPAGYVTNWNAGAQRMKGYTAEEIVGQHFSRFYTEEDRLAGLPTRFLGIAEREGRCEKEGWRVRKDGGLFWANVVIDAIRDDNGALIGFAKVTRDITERRRTQEALEEARQALFQSQKMEAVGQLTGGMAHDFNNLLQAMSGCLQLVGKRAGHVAGVQKILDSGRQAVDRGTRVIRQLMAFSRRQSLQPEAFDVRDQLLGMRAFLDRALRADIQLEFDLEAELWPAMADPVQFELAVLNLATNARDAIAADGQVVIGAGNVEFRGENGLHGDFVRVWVRDNGQGMAPEILGRVFEPFFTTKGVGQGTGLGLSQVYGFCQQSGGGATLESVPGHGTTVALLLPRAEAVAAAAEDDGRLAVADGDGARILLVEDDPVVAPVVMAALEDLGYRVLRATSGEEALRCLERGEEVDLLFSDVVMPGAVDGIALARAARHRLPNLAVVMTTGYSEDHTGLEGLPVLSKPYRIETLASVFQEELARRTRPNATGGGNNRLNGAQ